ncbi:MAG: cobalamin biosynthesis protein CobQ [Leptolyngbya sp. LCM1.Bin17]|nr:MAG: cobalamin biosynthesis protein CobQ [Leptolyngbya sp. LCM1.Bin17]
MASTALKRYWLALDRHRWASLASLLGVLGLSTVIALRPPRPPLYRAAGSLIPNRPVVALTATGSEVQQRGQGIISEDFLLAEVLLQRVSAELRDQGIDLDPETIRDRTQLHLDGDDDEVLRVRVTFDHPNPDWAQVGLTLLFEGMVELSRVANRAQLQEILTALDERLPAIEADLRTAEAALEAYDREQGPAIQAALDGSLLGAISGGQQQQRQNQLALASLNAQIQSLQQQLGLSPEEALTASALSADPIIAQLRSQILDTEAQLALLAASLRDAHPTIQELRHNLGAYNALLQERAIEVIGDNQTPQPTVSQVRRNSTLDPARANLANQLVALNTEREARLRQQQVLAQADGQLRQQYAGLPNKQLERDRLAQQVALNQALYDQIQAKRIDAEAAAAETVSSLTVAQGPTTALLERLSLPPLVIIALGGGFGLGLAIVVARLLDQLEGEGTLHTHDDLQDLLQALDVPLLGLMPTLTVASGSPLVLSAQPSLLADYERLRSNLQLIHRGTAQVDSAAAPTGILITSIHPQAGKTTTAINLGIAAAQAGRRTLIIEVNLGQASCCTWLGISRPSVLEPLHYYAGRYQDPIHMVPDIENLYMAPSPQTPFQAAVLESDEMQQFLTTARARFDLVLLDAPALTDSNHALVLATATDGLVVVARPGYTAKAPLATWLERLLIRSDLRLLGVVIADAGDLGGSADWTLGESTSERPTTLAGAAAGTTSELKPPVTYPIDL